MKEKTQTQIEMMDDQSRYSFMLGKLVSLDTAYRISAGRIGDLKSLKAQDVLLVQIESNFNFKKRVIKWHSHRVISCKVASKILTSSTVSTVRSKTIAAKLMRQITYTQLTCSFFCFSVLGYRERAFSIFPEIPWRVTYYSNIALLFVKLHNAIN